MGVLPRPSLYRWPECYSGDRFQLAQELLRFVGLITSEIASDLPAPGRRPGWSQGLAVGAPVVSDGAQAIVPENETECVVFGGLFA